MKNTDEIKDELYRKTVTAKSDAVLRVIGQRILQQREEEIAQIEIESQDFVVPQETHEKILQMIKEEKKAVLITKRRMKRKQFAKVCAMIILILGVSGTMLISNVEAFKYRFDNFLVEVKTEYLGLTPHEENTVGDTKEAQNLKGLWYPEYLPEGFEFTGSEDIGGMKRITWKDAEGQIIVISEIPAAGTKVYLDNESEESGQVKLNDKYDGYWIFNDGNVVLTWLQCDQVIEISAELELTELIKMAESMTYQK